MCFETEVAVFASGPAKANPLPQRGLSHGLLGGLPDYGQSRDPQISLILRLGDARVLSRWIPLSLMNTHQLSLQIEEAVLVVLDL
jgi:hypothetical protein